MAERVEAGCWIAVRAGRAGGRCDVARGEAGGRGGFLELVGECIICTGYTVVADVVISSEKQ